MMKIFFVLIVASSFLHFDAFALSKNSAREVLASIHNEFESDFEARKLKLKVNVDWKSPLKNAHTAGYENYIGLSLDGGLVSEPNLTKLGLVAIVCHELGHHLGGYPYFSGSGNDDEASSNEGQSDYWAAHECLPRFFEKDPETLKLEIDPSDSFYQKCSTKWNDEKQIKICMKSLKAGFESIMLLYELRQTELKALLSIPTVMLSGEQNARISRLSQFTMPSLSVEDQSEAVETFNGHPFTQCRLDTYVAGVLGLERPRCWYKPAESSRS